MFQPDELTTQLLRNNEPQPIPPQNLRVKTWFMENEKGKILAVDEGGAWQMLHPSKVINGLTPKYKVIGVSFGEPYARAVEDIKNIVDPLEKKKRLEQGFNEAVEEARGHLEYPRNPNILDINGKFQDDPRVLAALGLKR